MSYDDDILMAYADGELDAARRAQLEADMAGDPDLAARVQQHVALRARVAQAFTPVMREPVPASLEAAARGSASAADGARSAKAAPRGQVLQFPQRTTRAAAPSWSAREWTAVAASLMLGMFLTWRWLASSDAMLFVARDGTLVANASLASALGTQLASEQGDGPISIGVSFATTGGGYCRSFVVHASGTAGLGCRESGEWRIAVMQAVETQDRGGMRRATSSMPAAVLQAIEARREGEPLDAAAEKAARDAGWIR
jgi:hypothetical protein